MDIRLEWFGQQLGLLEATAVATGLLAVWLTVRRNIYCFPVGLVNVTLYALIFFSSEVRLYADGMLQIVFGLLLLYGWKRWSGNSNSDAGPSSTTSACSAWLLVCITVLTALCLGELLHRYTDAALPRLDAALTAVSLTAQWMVARKKIENWWLWIAVDTVYIPVYWSKGLPLTAGLYLIFLLMAAQGLLHWKKATTADTSYRAHG
jgi:nicotinamide mononucleotide transporter